MAKSSVLDPQLIIVRKPSVSGVTIHYNGELLELTSHRDVHRIFSVTDQRGAVVRTAHAWLRSLSMAAGITTSINSIVQYGHIVTYLVRWIEADGPYPDLSVDENILLLGRQDILRWLGKMKDEGSLSHATIHTREACIRSFLEWLTTEAAGRLRKPEDSPYGRDSNLAYLTATPAPRSPKFMPAETVIEILNSMYNECERCMFHFQFDTGLRISELVSLTREIIPDAFLYDPAYEFIPLCARRAKGRGGQTPEKATLVSRAVLNRLKRYHSSLEYKLAPDWDINDPAKPVFLTANQLKWSTRNASKQFKVAVRRTNVDADTSPHWLRHGTAFSVLRSDIGKSYEERMLIVQQMLGHAKLTTTEIYTHIPPSMLQKLTHAGHEMDRLREAEDIRQKTFLGTLQHSERRGHRA